MAENLQFGFDRTAALDARINELLYRFDAQVKPWPLTAEQRDLLRLLQWHKSVAQAITIADISAKLSIDARAVKEAVRSLVVDFRLPIMGSRRPPYGYYLAITPEEISQGLKTLRGEIVELARRIRSVESTNYLREMLGQIAVELEQEEVR